MARVFEFMIGSEGDPSVGIMGYEDKVTIIFHDAPDSLKQEDREDDEDFLRESLKEMTDGGWCVPLREYDIHRRQDAIADALEQEQWKRDHPEESQKH